jgi:ComF family protein
VVRALRYVAYHLLDALLPQTCVSCGEWVPAGRGLACESCHDELLTALKRPYCPRCGRTVLPPSIHEDGCTRCRSEHFWNLAGVARVCAYEPAARGAILDLKYRGQERNAEYLADLLAAAIRAWPWAGKLHALVPVPMHWLRRWQRPCDHARLLAEALGQRLKLPVLRCVRRVRHGPSQTGIPSKQQRFENVRGCFGPAGGLWMRVRGRCVCIVDNLMATGATVHEVSKVLRRLGAGPIYAAVIARTAAPGDRPGALPPTVDEGLAIS